MYGMLLNLRVKLKYASDKTLKEKLEIVFIKDHNRAIKFRFVNSIFKVATCFLYILEVVMSSSTLVTHHRNNNNNASSANETVINDDDETQWAYLTHVDRPSTIRYIQLALAVYGLTETLFYFFLTYNGNLVSKVTNSYFILELICTIPWIIEFTIPEAENMFIPVFLNCWLVKRNLNYIFKDYNNINVKNDNSVIGQHLISLATLFSCLIFTSLCGFQHLQRSHPSKSVSLFDSLYYIIITFSTVGYGDITPNSFPAKLFMGVMIIVALVVIPTQLESLASLWFERQNLGGSYYGTANDKHIVLACTHLQYDLVIDFLREFYAHRRNQNIRTVLLSTCELDLQIKGLLHTPLWKQRVFYIHGSVLRDSDLERAKVHQAKAVFVLSARGILDKNIADQHTILRSWAIKDFAPNTPQFVQMFRPENVVHVKFADYLICEDELKYALLANNCLCPGISTLITLLLHKSCKEAQVNLQEWQEMYGKLAGNEIHSIVAEGSKFFQEYIGESFTHASFSAHKKYNICLIGIGKRKEGADEPSAQVVQQHQDSQQAKTPFFNSRKSMKQGGEDQKSTFSNREIFLNPGNSYKLQPDDLCFYISLVKEENYEIKVAKSKIYMIEELCQNLLASGPELSMRTIANLKATKSELNFCALDSHASEFSSNWQASDSCKPPEFNLYESESSFLVDVRETDLQIGHPPNPLYIGCPPSLCKLLRVPTALCCLELNKECEHKAFAHASEYKWHNKCIILAAETATNGLFNFILPLRAQVRSTMFLRPIVLLLENKPSIEFLESICYFPLIYWIHGNLSNVSTLLKAGIMDSELIVVSPEKLDKLEDDSLSDCSNIVSVQNIHRLFPQTTVVAELSKASSIRFMKFRAKDSERERASNIAYMYRSPFAAGNVFSASMIDSLLYQAYGKPYLIELTRLLIGLNQHEGSGNLTSIPLTDEDMWIKTYGNLYRKLTSLTGEVPIGIYRTEQHDSNFDSRMSRYDLERIIILKMNKLGIDSKKYDTLNDNLDTISFVLINPSNDLPLQSGDIIYLLKPGQKANDDSTLKPDAAEKNNKDGVLASRKGHKSVGNSMNITRNKLNPDRYLHTNGYHNNNYLSQSRSETKDIYLIKDGESTSKMSQLKSGSLKINNKNLITRSAQNFTQNKSELELVSDGNCAL